MHLAVSQVKSRANNSADVSNTFFQCTEGIPEFGKFGQLKVKQNQFKEKGSIHTHDPNWFY